MDKQWKNIQLIRQALAEGGDNHSPFLLGFIHGHILENEEGLGKVVDDRNFSVNQVPHQNHEGKEEYFEVTLFGDIYKVWVLKDDS